MIVDVIMCFVLIAILITLFELGKTVSYYGYIIHNSIPTFLLLIKAVIQYITDKLKQFIRYIKRLIHSKKYQKLSVHPKMIDKLSQELELITGDI